MEDRENNNSQKIDPVQVRQVENVTYQNFRAAHEAEERRRQLNEAWQTLKDNNIDYDGKIFHNASLQSRKMDRRTFLKILAALSILVVAAKLGMIAKPEIEFEKAKKDTQDIINDLIAQKKYFGDAASLPEKITEENKTQIENLIKGIMDNSKNDEDNHLNRDQAIYAISLCGKVSNLYETYYGENLETYKYKYFSTYKDVADRGYANYMQYGLPVPNPKNDGEKGARGIDYVEGIRILEENIKSLNLQEESGKAL